MTNTIPSINDFLDEIDPKQSIAREKAMMEITSVVLLSAINESRNKLSDECITKLEEVLGTSEYSFENIYKVFEDAGKKEELFAAINTCLEKVRVDYINTHLEAMPEEKKEKVLDKFPSLRGLSN